MTQAEWLSCTDPQAMLEFLRGKVSDRKLRLFAVACCRRIWHLMTDERLRAAVESAERFADGLETESELALAHKAAVIAFESCPDPATFENDGTSKAAMAACEISLRKMDSGTAATVGLNAVYAAEKAACAAVFTPFTSLLIVYEAEEAAISKEHAAQSRLVQDIFNPYRKSWTASNCLAVITVTLAQSIYDSRSFEQLPILADSLEEAGCAEMSVLDHCRGPGPHVRGCWVVDLLLGKS
jgi:hypothetical protein